MDRKDEFLLQLIDRVFIISQGFDDNILGLCERAKDPDEEEYITKEIEDKIESISNDLGELYQMIGNVRFK